MVEQVVIMAGGKGTRLRPITYDIPKPMVPVNGKPFLEHQLELLIKSGFKRFLFCTGYLSTMISDHFQDGSSWGVSIEYSVEPHPLGTGGALKLAEPQLMEEFMLVNGDTLLQLDYKDLVHSFSRDTVEGYIVVYSNELKIAPNNINLDPQNVVIEYDKTNPGNKHYVDAGAQVFRKSMTRRIPGNQVISLEQDIFPRLIIENQFKGYVTHDRYYDMGTPERLALLEEILK